MTDGCIYVSANIKEPGVLVQHGKILRIVFGVREKTDWRPELEQIRQDFTDSAIDGNLSENIRREALEKFSYVSPIGAAGLYCNAVAGGFSERGRSAGTVLFDDPGNRSTCRCYGCSVSKRHGRC